MLLQNLEKAQINQSSMRRPPPPPPRRIGEGKKKKYKNNLALGAARGGQQDLGQDGAGDAGQLNQSSISRPPPTPTPHQGG
jgi:hypothetical protein